MTSADRRLVAMAKGQLGLFSREQANAIGVTDRQLRSRVASGTLVKSGPHSFRLPGTMSTPRVELTALMLDIGEPVYASGPTAAALHGFDGFRLAEPFDVTVPRGRNVRRLGHRVHTTDHLDPIDRCSVDGIDCLSPARTLIDLGRTAGHAELMAAYDSGLRDRRFTETGVHKRIVALRSSGRFGIPKLLDAIDEYAVGRGGHSFLERHFLALVHASGLPRPHTQEVLTRAADRLVRVDFTFPGTNVVVETLGYRYHRTPAQLSHDAARMNALVADGWSVFQFSYEQVVDDPGLVVETLRAALRDPRPAPHPRTA